MKTDTIFYQIFQNFLGIFFELIGEPAATGDIYEFISVEFSTRFKGFKLLAVK
jgi:predicted transposase YdaD